MGANGSLRADLDARAMGVRRPIAATQQRPPIFFYGVLKSAFEIAILVERTFGQGRLSAENSYRDPHPDCRYLRLRRHAVEAAGDDHTGGDDWQADSAAGGILTLIPGSGA